MHANAGTIGYETITDEYARQQEKQASRNRAFTTAAGYAPNGACIESGCTYHDGAGRLVGATVGGEHRTIAIDDVAGTAHFLDAPRIESGCAHDPDRLSRADAHATAATPGLGGTPCDGLTLLHGRSTASTATSVPYDAEAAREQERLTAAARLRAGRSRSSVLDTLRHLQRQAESASDGAISLGKATFQAGKAAGLALAISHLQ